MEYVILGVVLAAIVLVIWGLCLRPARTAILEKMLKREAQADAPEAQYDLTRLHLDGRGPARDTAEGLLRLQRAAGKGHAESQFRMAALHDTDAHGEYDPQSAYHRNRAATDQGHVRSQAVPTSGAGGTPPAELAHLEELAAQGDVDAMYDLGTIYYHGYGSGPDHLKALTWFRMAALHLDPQALYNLGLMYGRGEGTPKDLQESLRCFEKAAQEGHIQAQTILARLSPEG